jgi:CMP-N-acetylneuraminic acid synthetase
MSRIAIIPARGGSQGIPRKNISDLFGTPLVLWTICFAVKEEIFDSIIVSTDSEQIARVIAEEFNFNINFQKLKPGESCKILNNLFVHRRLDAHSGATSKTSDLVADLVQDFHLKGEDFIYLLQPTSPFRESHELEQISDLLAQGASHVVSVKKAESPHPKKVFQIDDRSKPVNILELSNLETPRQALGDYFAPDGAYYVTTVTEFSKNNSFVSQNLVTLQRKGIKTLNIDSPEDLETARLYAPLATYPQRNR